jgi:hypothetical protein
MWSVIDTNTRGPGLITNQGGDLAAGWWWPRLPVKLCTWPGPPGVNPGSLVTYPERSTLPVALEFYPVNVNLVLCGL